MWVCVTVGCLCPLVRNNVVFRVTCFKLIESTVRCSKIMVSHLSRTDCNFLFTHNVKPFHKIGKSQCLEILSPCLTRILREYFSLHATGLYTLLCWTVGPSVHPSVGPLVRQSVGPSVRRSVCWSVVTLYFFIIH